MPANPRRPSSLGKCLHCGAMAVKAQPSARFVNSAVYFQLDDLPISFASSPDNRVVAKVTIEIHSLDRLHQDDKTLTAIALQLALDRLLAQRGI